MKTTTFKTFLQQSEVHGARNSQIILSLIDRKGRVILQEYEFLAIIRSLRSANIVMLIKTRQEVNFLVDFVNPGIPVTVKQPLNRSYLD